MAVFHVLNVHVPGEGVCRLHLNPRLLPPSGLRVEEAHAPACVRGARHILALGPAVQGARPAL